MFNAAAHGQEPMAPVRGTIVMDASLGLGGTLAVGKDIVSANWRSIGKGGRSHAHAVLARPLIVVTTPIGRRGDSYHVIRTAAIGEVVDFNLSSNSCRDNRCENQA